MGRYDQAPRLINRKPKMDNNIIMISNEMYSAIFNAVGRKKNAGIVLVWLIGQADGFCIAQQTVMNSLGISKDSYYDSRKALKDLGFITDDGNTIIIHYDKILGRKESAPKNRGSENLPQKLGTGESTPILSTGDPTSILEGRKDSTPKGRRESTPMGRKDSYYNIEEHIKTDNSCQEILSRKESDSILGSQESTPILGRKDSDPIFDLENFKATVYDNSYDEDYTTTGAEILNSYNFDNDGEVEEMSNEFPEAYSDLVKLGMIKRTKWSF